jgi:membrane-associated protein
VTADRVLEAMANQDMIVVGLVTFAILAAETSLFVGLLVPGDVVALFAGATVGHPLEFAALAGIAALGSLVGESAGYLIGRGYGRRLRHSRLGARLGERRWRRAERLALGRDGGWALVTSRFVPVLHSMVPVLAGALGVPYRRFIAWEAAGGLLWGATYVGVGSLVGAGLRGHGPLFGYTGSALLVVLVLVIAVVTRRLRTA